MIEDEPSRAERRALSVELRRSETGIDEALIERVVHGFYALIRNDALLGPVFAARIADWDSHLKRMCQFWSSIILASGEYHGRPMQKHMPLPVEATHFDRWLDLFRRNAREICPPAAAALLIEKAELIAKSLELGVASAHGVLLAQGERFARSAPERA